MSIYREARFEASHERAGWPEPGQFEVDGRKRVGSLIQIGEETPERTRKTARQARREGRNAEEMVRNGQRQGEGVAGLPSRGKKGRTNDWRGFRTLMTANG